MIKWKGTNKKELLEEALRYLAGSVKDGSATPKQAIDYLSVLHVWFHNPELLANQPQTQDDSGTPGGPPPPPPGGGGNP